MSRAGSRANSRSNSPLLPRSSVFSPPTPYTPNPSRLSIRAPLASIAAPSLFQRAWSLLPKHRTRRLPFLVLLTWLVFYIIWTGSNRLSAASGITNEERKCRLLPWTSSCIGGGHHPFDLLHFERRNGYLFYPGHSVGGDQAAVKAEAPSQPHIIHLLMDRAKRDWRRKVSSQSKTLREAVEEYERRYGRRPPKGFGDWWWFAKGQDYVLVDEFDGLEAQIKPFLAIPPSVLRERHETIQHDEKFWIQDKTFTIELRELGRYVFSHGPMKGVNERPEQMIKLISGIARFLPDLNITFTGHDNPWIVASGEAKAIHLARAETGEYVDDKDLVDPRDNWEYDGWAVACPPNSPLRATPRFDERLLSQSKWVPPPPSFIQDHPTAMDVCLSPERQTIHGFTAWPGPRPGLLYPLFTFTTTPLHSDLLVPPIDQYDRPLGHDPTWEDKKHDKVVWRGSTTGAALDIEHMRKWSQRPRLCRLPNTLGTKTLTFAPNDKPGQLGPTEEITGDATKLAAAWFDFKFLGKPEQCFDPVACEAFAKEFEWSEWMSQDEQNEYKYQIDVDGNGWSGRFHRLLSSNSLVFKSTIFPEWYSSQIQPWLHYVPISTDYEDLWATMAFFKGDENGRGAHDSLAKHIATEGKKWTEKHWRWADMEVYMYRLLLEYARLMKRADSNPDSYDM